AHTLSVLLSGLSRRTLHSITSRLTHRLREERFDDFCQVGALAFRAVHLLRLVLLDGQHFVKFVMTLAANVFVKRHRSVQLGVEYPVRFFRQSSLTNLAKSSPALPVPSRIYRSPAAPAPYPLTLKTRLHRTSTVLLLRCE